MTSLIKSFLNLFKVNRRRKYKQIKRHRVSSRVRRRIKRGIIRQYERDNTEEKNRKIRKIMFKSIK